MHQGYVIESIDVLLQDGGLPQATSSSVWRKVRYRLVSHGHTDIVKDLDTVHNYKDDTIYARFVAKISVKWRKLGYVYSWVFAAYNQHTFTCATSRKAMQHDSLAASPRYMQNRTLSPAAIFRSFSDFRKSSSRLYGHKYHPIGFIDDSMWSEQRLTSATITANTTIMRTAILAMT